MNSASVTATKSGPSFEGKADQQELAAKVFELMRRQGMLYAADAPIVTPLDRIVQGLQRAYPDVSADKLRSRVEAALKANGQVFARVESGGAVAYETTKSGKHRVNADEGRHMFRQRLNADARAVSEEESRELTDGWIAQAQARAESFTIFQEPAAEAAVAGHWQSPADIAAYVAPNQPVRGETPIEPLILPELPPLPPLPGWAREMPPAAPEVGGPAVEVPSESVAVPEAIAPAPPVEVPEPLVAPSTMPDVLPAPVLETPVAPTASVPEPAVPSTPPPPARAVAPLAPPRPVRYDFETGEGIVTIDLNTPIDDIMAEYGPALEAMLDKALREDFRFASFGEDWFPEEGIERFSKGDFRRIKDYLIETQEALSDRTFLNDVLNRRENDPDYERLRFSLDYRLLREKKDFEYVGVPSDRLWIGMNASPASAPKRKPSELGQDFRYLEDTLAQELEPIVPPDTTMIEHALTLYEYENGVLPYDAAMRQIAPRPMLEEQRAVLLRIEVASLFQNFPVELRYPTGNRGGYLVGFDAFFQENLVPGTIFTLEMTDQPNVLILRYERTAAQEDSLLQVDERRGRYNFRPTTFYAETSPDWLLSARRYPRLEGLKRLDETDRKKPETVVEHAFELVGEQMDGRLYALASDLLPVINLDRPLSLGGFLAIVTGDNPAYEADPDTAGAFYFDPSKR